jgi:transcriptional regulator
MYIPRPFALTDEKTATALRDAGFAYLVTASTDGLMVSPIPFLYDEAAHSLVGHVSRANPHWKADGAESVAIFAGPHAYISPNLYPTKSETGRVVPTWNYEIVNVYGRLAIHDDQDWVLNLVTGLTNRHERAQEKPWQVTDAPDDFTAAQLRAIVGVELVVSHVEGKAKMSQNQPERNRAGVIAGLTKSASVVDRAVAKSVAERDRRRVSGHPPETGYGRHVAAEQPSAREGSESPVADGHAT